MDIQKIKVIKFFLTILIPIFLITGAVRILASEQYLAFEYRRPDFPEDLYGFVYTERLDLADANLRFVREGLPVEALSSQLVNGQAAYNNRELDHMLDVQLVYQWTVRTGQVVFLILLVSGYLLARGPNKAHLLSALQAGGWLTAGLLFVLGSLAVIAWQIWFTAFHQVFFAPGTWQFASSDTLIRLFPQKFWFDAAVNLTVIGIAGGILTAAVARRWLGFLKAHLDD